MLWQASLWCCFPMHCCQQSDLCCYHIYMFPIPLKLMPNSFTCSQIVFVDCCKGNQLDAEKSGRINLYDEKMLIALVSQRVRKGTCKKVCIIL